MSKITEYTSASTFDANDVLLKDGENGTMIISVEDAASELKRLSGVDDDISGVTQTVTQRIDTIASDIAGVETDYIASKDYAIGDLFIVNNVLYKATAAIAEEDIIDTETNCAVVNLGNEIGDIRSELSNKANVDGSYDEFTAGSSKQLLGTVFIEDDEPYLFRTSGGSIDIGDREYDEIVGGSIVWNQIIQNGNFADGTDWGLNPDIASDLAVANNIATVTMRADPPNSSAYIKNVAHSGIAGHVIFSAITVNPSRDVSVQNLYPSAADGVHPTDCPANSWTVVGNIIRLKSFIISVHYFDTKTSLKENDTIQFKNANVFDLTQMFGSEIADYIYNLEQTTPGAGVAWFRKYFPKDYYEYNAGELMHVSDLQSHDTVGFNVWDEEWEVGDISSTTGQNVESSGVIRTKNYIPVIPGATYFVYIGSQIGIGSNLKTRFYDVDKNYIGTLEKRGKQVTYNTRFIVPDNACYMRFTPQSSYGTTYNHDICINLSWDGERDGEYEPYVKRSYPLDPSLTLRGIPKLSTDGKLYYDGDHYKSDGTVERRYGIVDLGTLAWTYHNTYEMFVAVVSNKKFATPNMLVSSIYTKTNVWFSSPKWPNVDKVFTYIGNDASVRFKNTDYTDAESFKAAMSGVYLVYELAEPTTEEAQPYQSPQIVDDFGTEEYVTSSIVPVGHTTQYDSNLRAKLEMAPNSPDGDGDYLVRQTGGQNEYVPYTDGGRITALESKIPAAPSANGSYILKCTVTDGTATYAWVAE